MAITNHMLGDKNRGDICVFKTKRGTWSRISSSKLGIWLIKCEIMSNKDQEWL